jgi:hypothetical protein
VIISFVFGLVLAQRFRVVVLFPAIALALIFTVGTEVGRAEAAWTLVQSATAAVVGLQLGYLAGIAARHLVLTRLLITRQTVFPDQASYPSQSSKRADWGQGKSEIDVNRKGVPLGAVGSRHAAFR